MANSSNIEFETPQELTDLIDYINAERSANAGFARWAQTGRVRVLAKALADFADRLDESGYVPPVAKAEVARLEQLARQVGDPGLAAGYAAKAAALAKQIEPEGTR